MLSHFKFWGEAACQQRAFDAFLDEVFTDASLAQLRQWGLFAWGFMDDHYINDPGPTYDKAVRLLTWYY